MDVADRPTGWLGDAPFCGERENPCLGPVANQFSVRVGSKADGLHHVDPEQRLERLSQVGTGLDVDVELLEERLVEQPPGVVVGGQVRLVTVGREVESDSQIELDVVKVGLTRRQARLYDLELRTDAILFRLEQVQRDGTRVVRLEQLRTLLREAFLANGERTQFRLRVASNLGELSSQGRLDPSAQLRRELEAGVKLLDLRFDVGNEEGLLEALGALLVASQADEVRIHRAVAVLRVGDDEAAAAHAAVDG